MSGLLRNRCPESTGMTVRNHWNRQASLICPSDQRSLRTVFLTYRYSHLHSLAVQDFFPLRDPKPGEHAGSINDRRCSTASENKGKDSRWLLFRKADHWTCFSSEAVNSFSKRALTFFSGVIRWRKVVRIALRRAWISKEHWDAMKRMS